MDGISSEWAECTPGIPHFDTQSHRLRESSVTSVQLCSYKRKREALKMTVVICLLQSFVIVIQYTRSIQYASENIYDNPNTIIPGQCQCIFVKMYKLILIIFLFTESTQFQYQNAVSIPARLYFVLVSHSLYVHI